MIKVSGANGERHHVWAITEAEATARICQSLASQPLYIADGHHRYESALIHRRERLTYSPSAGQDAGFNFVMMTLVDFSDPGLIILPPHRLVRGVPKANMNRLLDGLRAFFAIEELPLGPDTWPEVDSLLARGQTSQDRLILFGPVPDRLFVLKLTSSATGDMMPYFHCELYKKLMVSLVDHIILERLLGLAGDSEATLAYSYDSREAVNRVLEQEYQLAFLLSPVKAGVIKAIADAGDRMPRKSTYFYPKCPAGLVFYRLV